MKKFASRALSLTLTLLMIFSALSLPMAIFAADKVTSTRDDISVITGTSGGSSYYKEDTYYDLPKLDTTPSTYEFEVAAAGESICRINGATSFAYSCIVGSGERAKAVVPTATNKLMKDGELVMIGIAPRYNGYAGTFGDTLPVNGVYTQKQKDLLNHMRETFRLTYGMLKPGMSGREIDVPGRLYYEKHGLKDYIVCPFAHSIGLMEAEAPFFGPNGDFVLVPGMTVMVDVSFFGHPDLHGGRIETGFVITENGAKPLSQKMFDYFMKDL